MTLHINDDHVQRLLRQLKNVRPSGKGWLAQCPCFENHNNGDVHPSLSIGIGDDRKILLNCLSQHCPFDEILTRLDLHPQDLFADSACNTKGNNGAVKKTSKIYSSLKNVIEAVAQSIGGKFVEKWSYTNNDGSEYFVVVRFETSMGKTYRPFHKVVGGYICGCPTGQLPLYRLPDLEGADLVFVVEGEKAAEAGRSIGLLCTTTTHGSGSAAVSDWSPLSGKAVVILPDNDEVGRKYAESVSAILMSLKGPAKVKIVNLNPQIVGEGGDLADWIQHDDHRDSDDLKRGIEEMADDAPYLKIPIKPTAAETKPEEDKDGARASQATKLVQLIEKQAELFCGLGHNAEAYMRIRINDHFENLPLKSTVFRKLVSHIFYDEFGKILNAQAFVDAQATLAGMAIHEGKSFQIELRIAEFNECIYIDLGNEKWEAIEISANGWTVVPGENVPVRFIRKNGMLSLPTPVHGGSITELRTFLNLPDDNDWILVVAWLIGAVASKGPYPILCVNGEHGTAKSTLCRILRSLIDPSKMPLRRPPNNEHDLMIAAKNSRIVGFDNLSGVRLSLSDALCCLSTGGGFATRALYTDDDEIILEATRPIILNGIDDLTSRPDLMDRSIHLCLNPIPSHERKEEAILMEQFEMARSGILGALCDAISCALKNINQTKLAAIPRMADFARWVVAAESALPWKPGEFLKAYSDNCQAAHELAIELEAIGPSIVALINSKIGGWCGSATELLNELESNHADEQTIKRRDWPKSARSLSNKVKRLAPALRVLSIEVDFSRESGGSRKRLIAIRKVGKLPSLSSQPSLNSMETSENADFVGRSGDNRDVNRDANESNLSQEFPPETSKRDDGDDRNGRDDTVAVLSGTMSSLHSDIAKSDC